VQFGRILDVAVSPDGQRILAGGEDKTMIVWDMNTGDVVHAFESCSGTINSSAFSPDGRYIAGGFGALSEPTRGQCPENDLSIHLWDASGKIQQS
jgi:WD40 repeat protein